MYGSSLQFIKNEWGKHAPTNVLVYPCMQKKKVGKKTTPKVLSSVPVTRAPS